MLKRQLLAECFGTFCLVFAGTGAIVVDQLTGGGVSHVGVALTFGLVVLVMINALGDVSGCHINPAVTLGFWVAGRLSGSRVLPYLVAQCAGSLAASGSLRVLFPAAETLGETVPAGSLLQSALIEVLLTFILMTVILSVATGGQEKGLLAGITIGALIALEALFAGPISGASMNPARSLGPAVMLREFDSLWIYLLSPCLGAVAAVPLCRLLFSPNGAASPEPSP